jgi:hypothetical protein
MKRPLHAVFHETHFGKHNAEEWGGGSREWGRAFTSKREADRYARGCRKAGVSVIRVSVPRVQFSRSAVRKKGKRR